MVGEWGRSALDQGPTVTLAVALLPSKSVAWTTSMPGVAPAVYAPVLTSMVPPDGLVGSVQAYGGPLPPLALKVWLPRGATLAVAGAMEMPAPTVTLRVVVLPSESVTRTTSMTPPVAPAVYAPVFRLMVPPEAFVDSVQEYPVPLPPLAVKACVPRGATLAVAGAMESTGMLIATDVEFVVSDVPGTFASTQVAKPEMEKVWGVAGAVHPVQVRPSEAGTLFTGRAGATAHDAA
jgi:hypothetical protein